MAEEILVHERLGILETKMDRIIEQTTKTNGTVANLKLWQARILGALSILSAIIVPILFMFLSKWLDNIT